MKGFFAGIAAVVLVALSSSTSSGVHAQDVDATGLLPFTCSKSCKFPAHSIPVCGLLSPCGFICIDGFLETPLLFPKSCTCKFPFSECNGKCGIFKACSSKSHTRRDLSANDANCPAGQEACGILGRSTGSWECVNTQSDLESCGGCLVSATNELRPREGQDCTAIEGVSDVSCNQGKCVVRKCMAGYEIDAEDAGSCKPIERTKSIFSIAENVLAAEFGAA